MRDYTLDEARAFLRKDFAKVLKRIKYLYVDHIPPPQIGEGFSEPVLLSLCWCNFLGALYSGCRTKNDTKLTEDFIKEVLGEINEEYRNHAKLIVRIYRHGAVHAYAPKKAFRIVLREGNAEHLKETKDCITICADQLLDDLLEGTERFADKLQQQKRLDNFNRRAPS